MLARVYWSLSQLSDTLHDSRFLLQINIKYLWPFHFKPLRQIVTIGFKPLGSEQSAAVYRDTAVLFHSQLEQMNQFHLRVSGEQTVSSPCMDMNI